MHAKHTWRHNYGSNNVSLLYWLCISPPHCILWRVFRYTHHSYLSPCMYMELWHLNNRIFPIYAALLHRHGLRIDSQSVLPDAKWRRSVGAWCQRTLHPSSSASPKTAIITAAATAATDMDYEAMDCEPPSGHGSLWNRCTMNLRVRLHQHQHQHNQHHLWIVTRGWIHRWMRRRSLSGFDYGDSYYNDVVDY